MYRISNEDERILVRVGEHDKIECLNPVLGEEVVSTLKAHKILTIGELTKRNATCFYEMPDIGVLEREKIIIVCHWLLSGTHGVSYY